MLATPVHLTILKCSQTVNSLIFVKWECLSDAIFSCIGACCAGLELWSTFLTQQYFTLCQECQRTCLRVNLHREHTAAHGVTTTRNLHLFGLGYHHQTITLILMTYGCLGDTYRLRSVKFQPHMSRTCLNLDRFGVNCSSSHTKQYCQNACSLFHIFLISRILF